jgi:hypothetical protein
MRTYIQRWNIIKNSAENISDKSAIDAFVAGIRRRDFVEDETRINIAELSEKELLDEVRRLTLFSQEDSIPLISSYSPLDADHPPSEVIFLLILLLLCST